MIGWMIDASSYAYDERMRRQRTQYFMNVNPPVSEDDWQLICISDRTSYTAVGAVSSASGPAYLWSTTETGNCDWVTRVRWCGKRVDNGTCRRSSLCPTLARTRSIRTDTDDHPPYNLSTDSNPTFVTEIENIWKRFYFRRNAELLLVLILKSKFNKHLTKPIHICGILSPVLWLHPWIVRRLGPQTPCYGVQTNPQTRRYWVKRIPPSRPKFSRIAR